MERFYIAFNRFDAYLVLHRLQQAGIPASDGGPIAEFVAYVLSPPGAHWCGGDCTAMLQTALSDAVNDLTRRFG